MSFIVFRMNHFTTYKTLNPHGIFHNIHSKKCIPGKTNYIFNLRRVRWTRMPLHCSWSLTISILGMIARVLRVRLSLITKNNPYSCHDFFFEYVIDDNLCLLYLLLKKYEKNRLSHPHLFLIYSAIA